MPLSRRKFIIRGLLAFPIVNNVLGITQVFAKTGAKQEIILGGGQYIDPKTHKIQHVFSVYNLTNNEKSIINMDFLPHGICLQPNNPLIISIFEKKGPHACEFDLSTLTVSRVIKTDPNRHFYGHGTYSKDGKLLYCTETYLDTRDGIIAVRDAKTLNYLAEFPTYGKEPHECLLTDKGKTLIITNGGGDLEGLAPSITYVDIKTARLIEQVTLTNARINTGHLALGQNNNLIVVSAPRAGLETTDLGGVSIRNKTNALLDSISKPSAIASRMKGEALSVVVYEPTQIAAVTHPSGNMVTFWSLNDHKLLKSMDLQSPRGVTLTTEKNAFVISYSKNAKMLEVDVNTLQIIDGSQRNTTYITGSHLYNWSAEVKKLHV